MAISPISNTMPYTTPSFKGAPMVKPAAAKKVADAASSSGGFFKSLKDSYNKHWDNFIENGVIKHVLKPVMNSKFMEKFADKTVSIDNMPSHMATAGSVVTTYFYANRTLHTLNKDEEQKKRAKVLVGNQVLVTAVSTAMAYGANDMLKKMSKNLGYKFREANQGHPKLAGRMKGFDVAKQLLIFTMMYRYVAPVIVTPVASKLGKVYEHYKAKKADNAQLNAQNNQPAQPVAKEVNMNTFGNFKKSA